MEVQFKTTIDLQEHFTTAIFSLQGMIPISIEQDQKHFPLSAPV